MFPRVLTVSETNNYFLFGARGTGKTTFLHQKYDEKVSVYIDLLNPVEEDIFARSPEELIHRTAQSGNKTGWVVIDEIQKVPRLLNVVHSLIEKGQYKFVLTGSSARKLKRGASNLLAGRAFVYNLYPLTHRELGKSFDLKHALKWGTLPKIFDYNTEADISDYLRAYALTYLKEEIAAEQIIRKLDPFRTFLEIAAQANGRILNFSNIAIDVGVDPKTVQTYFSILEDTLIGTLLHPYHTSVRKRQRSNPKFYFFDTGVKRALDRTLTLDILEKTYGYGDAFEHFVLLEIFKLSAYARNDWQFSYLRTKDDAEIDLIIDRPGMPKVILEIKSTNNILKKHCAGLQRFIPDMKPCEAFCFSRDPHKKRIGTVSCLPWDIGLNELGL